MTQLSVDTEYMDRSSRLMEDNSQSIRLIYAGK